MRLTARRNRLPTAPARCYRLGVQSGSSHCFTFLAADRQQQEFARPTSPRKTCVRVFCAGAAGRYSSRQGKPRRSATGCGACGYKTASGRSKWPNRDPLGEYGFEAVLDNVATRSLWENQFAELSERPNLYEFVENDPEGGVDLAGLALIPKLFPNPPPSKSSRPPYHLPPPPPPPPPSVNINWLNCANNLGGFGWGTNGTFGPGKSTNGNGNTYLPIK
jgi:hypothetical protein